MNSLPKPGGAERFGGPQRPAADGCPDAELLAAFAEGRLRRGERADVERHVARCNRCYEGVSAAFGLDRARARRQTWTYRGLGAAAAVAAAAALVLVVGPRDRTGLAPIRPELRELVAAAGTTRAIEPRISGGFAYGPLQPVLRSGEPGSATSSPEVRIAAARLEQQFQASDRPEDLALVGAAHLLVADVDKAIAALEAATDSPSPDPYGLSDLAAAYLVKGVEGKQSQDVAKALAFAERATRINPRVAEASFNRALAMERLHLPGQARHAWMDYLKLDERSGWADEARRHAEALYRSAKIDDAAARRQFVAEAARGANPRQLEDAIQRFPHVARDWAESEILSAWPSAVLGGKVREAADSLGAVRRVGDELARETGDRFLKDAVAAVDRSAADRLMVLASAHRTFGEGMLKYEEDARAESIRLFTAAFEPLERAGSPFAVWTRLQFAIGSYFSQDLDAASDRLAPVVPAAAHAGYIRLHGLALRLEGLLHGVRGRFPEQLGRYRLALRSFEQARDPESVAAIHASMAENMDNLGEPQLGWFHRSAALAGLSDVKRFRRRQAMLLGSANSCLQQGLPHAALAFQSAALDNAREWDQPVAVAEAYLYRAEAQHRLGLSELAAADLAEANVWAGKLGEDQVAPRLRARILLASGEIHQQSAPAVSVAELNSAIGYFQKAGLRSVVARAFLARGRAQVAAGRLDLASADFMEGIRAFELQRASTRDEDIRVAFFDRPWDLFTEMIRLRALHQSQPESALAFAEQSRSRTLLEAVSGSAETVPPLPTAVRGRLPRNMSVLYYSVLADRVLYWTVQPDGVSFFDRPIRESQLSRLVEAARSPARAGTSDSLARLYDELIRPALGVINRESGIVVVPDGVLHNLPFAALIDRTTGRYLIQDRSVATAPSLAILVESEGQQTPVATTALVVGNPRFSEPELRLPDLAGAEGEAREIAAAYPDATLLTGAAATREDFLERIGRNQIVHFAGHAISNASFPALSRLLFASRSFDTSGSLFARDLAGRDLSAVQIVVLAGCRTSTGQIRRGEGVMSLARPFLAAGVPTVLATLWDVDDRASRPLFVEFHRGLRRGLPAVDALRQAQLRLLESGNPDLTSPASWAAVTAIGGVAGWRTALPH